MTQVHDVRVIGDWSPIKARIVVREGFGVAWFVEVFVFGEEGVGGGVGFFGSGSFDEGGGS